MRPDPALSSTLSALESAWRDIQIKFPKVPRVAIYIASGEGKQYGHFGLGERWISREDVGGDSLPEVMIAGEGLHRSVEDVFGTLLHEAVHAWNYAEGVKDFSRGGQYHNQRFKKRAEVMLLDVSEEVPNGWCRTRLTLDGRVIFADAIARLERSMALYMRDLTGLFGQKKARPATEEDGDNEGEAESEGESEEEKKPASRMLRAECSCGRVIRASAKVLRAGEISCSLCSSPFVEG